jgi:hypothetical protein
MILPVGIDIMYWAASLRIDFPNDNIPILTSESAWKQWGNELLLSESFDINNIPSTEYFDKWDEWAMKVFLLMQNSNAGEGDNV